MVLYIRGLDQCFQELEGNRHVKHYYTDIVVDNIMEKVITARHPNTDTFSFTDSPKSSWVEIKIQVPQTYHVQLVFTHFQIPYSLGCRAGAITLYSEQICGTLSPWAIYSSGNQVQFKYRYGTHLTPKYDISYKLSLFYQPFSVKGHIDDTQPIADALYTNPSIYYNGIFKLDTLAEYKALFVLLQLHTLPGYVITILEHNFPCDYFDGPNVNFPKLSVTGNDYVTSTGHIIMIVYQRGINNINVINKDMKFSSSFRSIYEVHNIAEL